MLGLKVLPREVSILQQPVIFWFIIAVIVSISLAIRVKISEKSQKLFSLFLLLSAPLICLWNTERILENRFENMSSTIIILNYCIYLAVFMLLILIFNRTSWAVILGSTIFYIFAVVDSFVWMFRGTPLRAADVYATKTAGNIMAGYKIVLPEKMIVGMLIAISLSLFACHCTYKECNLKKRITKNSFIVFYLVVLIGVGFNKDNLLKWGINPEGWDAIGNHQRQGGVLSFMAGFPFIKLDVPDNYSIEEVQEILDGSEADDELGEEGSEKPNIIFIMNESFADIEVLSDLPLSEEPLKYFNSLTDNVVKGNLTVPVYGGGTCNSEFEALTGFATSFFPKGIYPYMSYIKDETMNMGQQLKDMEEAYSTTFMHLHDRSGWNREAVYEMFGFDEQIYVEDVGEVEYNRDYVTDKCNYEKLIEQYEANTTNGEKQFIFNVTIQNHGAYWKDYENQIQIVGEEGKYLETERYLTLLKESDMAFEKLIEYFEKREEPVIVCMFGDHWPNIDSELIEKMKGNAEGNEVEIMAKMYQTPFVIWANYDIEEKEYENISANYLSSLILKTAGLSLNSYQKYLMDLMEEYPVINPYVVKDKDGKWYTWEEAKEFEKVKEYERVQYYEFGDKKRR